MHGVVTSCSASELGMTGMVTKRSTRLEPACLTGCCYRTVSHCGACHTGGLHQTRPFREPVSLRTIQVAAILRCTATTDAFSSFRTKCSPLVPPSGAHTTISGAAPHQRAAGQFLRGFSGHAICRWVRECTCRWVRWSIGWSRTGPDVILKKDS